MRRESRLTAGLLSIAMPAVVYGGAILSPRVGDPGYAESELRPDLCGGQATRACAWMHDDTDRKETQ